MHFVYWIYVATTITFLNNFTIHVLNKKQNRPIKTNSRNKKKQLTWRETEKSSMTGQYKQEVRDDFRLSMAGDSDSCRLGSRRQNASTLFQFQGRGKKGL